MSVPLSSLSRAIEVLGENANRNLAKALHLRAHGHPNGAEFAAAMADSFAEEARRDRAAQADLYRHRDALEDERAAAVDAENAPDA